ncbi:S8/S53 family peptidase, partial [Knoellia locipacati]
WGDGIGGGSGGRFPVVWSAPVPKASVEDGPVVAVLDTGLGAHPWFDTGVERHPDGSASSLGVTFPAGHDPEDHGVTIDPVNGHLDRLAGHGTFIAGVIRQHCPDARILSVPVMWGDGVADEVDVVRALTGLYARQLIATRDGDPTRAVHVVTLSLGYRHETPGAFDDEEALFRVLRGLAALGVTVVAAVGNDASDVEFFPAAYAAQVTTGAPMVSVGALNPDRRTVSVYSNTGPWVQAYLAATSVVSTMPTTFNASRRGQVLQPADATAMPAVPTRGAVDTDDYSGGFGVWSGTSFAAPALAGDIARGLGTRLAKGADELGERARKVVAAVLETAGKALEETP